MCSKDHETLALSNIRTRNNRSNAVFVKTKGENLIAQFGADVHEFEIWMKIHVTGPAAAGQLNIWLFDMLTQAAILLNVKPIQTVASEICDEQFPSVGR